MQINKDADIQPTFCNCPPCKDSPVPITKASTHVVSPSSPHSSCSLEPWGQVFQVLSKADLCCPQQGTPTVVHGHNLLSFVEGPEPEASGPDSSPGATAQVAQGCQGDIHGSSFSETAAGRMASLSFSPMINVESGSRFVLRPKVKKSPSFPDLASLRMLPHGPNMADTALDISITSPLQEGE